MQPIATQSAQQEWRSGWNLVLAAGAGMSVSPVMVYTMGLFIEPLETRFGWSRTLITSGLTVNSVVAVLFAALVGSVIDRFGPRRIAIPGVLLFCTAFGLLSTASGSSFQWWMLWTLVAVGGLLIKPTVWTAAVVSRFNAARGLATALALCGGALSAFVAPIVGRVLIASYGWQWAYIGLAAIWAAVTLPLLYLFFYGVADLDRVKTSRSKGNMSSPVPGMDISRAFRSSAFIKLAGASAMTTFTLTSAVIHFVPLVAAGGLSRSTSIAAASVIGAASVAGRLVSGMLLDRVNGARLGGTMFALPLLAFAGLLLFNGSTALAIAIAAVIGFAMGAELEIASYLTSRYFGMKNFGTIFGLIVGFLTLATGVGPLAASYVYDLYGSYVPALWAALPIAAICSWAIFTLGSYPESPNA